MRLALITIIFLSFKNLCISFGQDNIEVIKYDPLPTDSKNKKNESNELIVFGGLGLVTDLIDWRENLGFGFGPVVSLGLEIPFSSDRRISLELYSHLWIAKSTKDAGYYQRIYYFDLGNDTYTQGGLSTVIKLCLGEFKIISNELLWFGHIGNFVNFKGDYKTIDFGMSLNYQLNNNFSLSLHNRYLLSLTFNGETQQNPNLLMLNTCYKFKW